MAIGILLSNLGTPDAPEAPEVRTYLKQFLMDPDVVDIPYVARWLLVHGLILPRRPKASAEAYRKVWTERGSPLLFHHLDLCRKVQEYLGPEYVVEPGMRYGNPSIPSAVQALLKCGVSRIVFAPLYPQYSLAASHSSEVEFDRALREAGRPVPALTLPEFHRHESFIGPFGTLGREFLAEHPVDHVLFSFHGLPERQCRKTDPTGTHCFATPDCCAQITAANSKCYRAQCFATAADIAKRAGLGDDRYSVSFQSRLGRTPWIKPYTDFVLPELPKKGIRRLAVFCPSFVADCLETLEEVQIRARAQFRECGGEELYLIPSLNSRDDWAAALADRVRAS